MDANTAILLGSLSASVASVAVASISAYAAIQSGRKSDDNHAILTDIAPKVTKVETQTNHMQEVMQAQATALGRQAGREEERLNPSANKPPKGRRTK